MAGKKIKPYNRKGDKWCSGHQGYLNPNSFTPAQLARNSGYCRDCQKDCNLRSRSRQSFRKNEKIESDIKKRNENYISTISREFKKAVELALKNQDYSQHLVNSMDATRDLFGAQQNESAALQYSNLRFRA